MPSSALFTIASLIWGSTFFAITLQLGEAPPAVSVAYRFFLAAATLFVICLARRDSLRLPLRTHGWMALQGVLTFCISYLCTYESEQYVVSGLVAVVFALMVFWTPLLSRLFFGTGINGRTIACGVAAIAGVALLFWHSIGTAWQDYQRGGSAHFIAGVILALVATIASSAGSIVVSKVKEQCANLPLTMAWSMLWGAMLVTVWLLLKGERFVLPASPTYWAGLLYLSIFGSVIAFFAYFTLINRIGAQKTVYIGVITPVLSVLLSIKLEGYRPGAIEFAGMILCLASVAWALRAPAAKAVQSANLNNPLETP
ncbi:DMT family transporter [Massilia yuzhufengensis]|uniref:Permease of the drug/metabolite transporter (DMT) superfamily n=1 Tax=Massilia yuzhufengensis TaxID=1164594 RepID=A0A1I1X5J9_9BURK|nr:EamA family transporter [Massilia yuzhufengensis]SFE02491.1 Permease of the drug/metabolite transporter (DMT) superfamily [Massilia yuzhufengensis]